MGQNWAQVAVTTGTLNCWEECGYTVWYPRSEGSSVSELSPGSRSPRFPAQCSFHHSVFSGVHFKGAGTSSPTHWTMPNISLPEKPQPLFAHVEERQKGTTEMEWVTSWTSKEKQEKDKGSTSYPRKGTDSFLTSSWLRSVPGASVGWTASRSNCSGLHWQSSVFLRLQSGGEKTVFIGLSF